MDHTSGAAPRHTTGWPGGSNGSGGTRATTSRAAKTSSAPWTRSALCAGHHRLPQRPHPQPQAQHRHAPQRPRAHPRLPNPRPPPTPPRTTPLPPPRPSRPLRPLAQAPLPRRGGFQTRLSSPQNAARNSHMTKRNCDDRSPGLSTLSCLLLPLLEVDIDSYRGSSRSGTGNEEELPECRIVE